MQDVDGALLENPETPMVEVPTGEAAGEQEKLAEANASGSGSKLLGLMGFASHTDQHFLQF